MAVKKTIAIIGAADNNDGAIARSLAKDNYRLLLIGQDINKLAYLANGIIASVPSAEIDTMDCAFNGCWEADIIILDMPYPAQKEIAEKIRDVATGKTVISICNGMHQTPTAKEPGALQEILPYSKVLHLTATTEINGAIDAVIKSDDVRVISINK